MLEKQKNQEKMIMIFFVVTLMCVGFYVVLDKCLIDVMYMGVVIYYFGRFISIKTRR